jgi:hypothetical protein
MQQALLSLPAVHSATDNAKFTDWYVLALFVALSANQVSALHVRSSVAWCAVCILSEHVQRGASETPASTQPAPLSPQAILWFTFSSASTPGVLEYYGFTDGTVDLLLAWGPIGGIIFQPVATALLSTSQSDGLGLRASMLAAGTLSLLCAALRLLPSILSDQRRRSYSTLTASVLSLAQLLNAAAGPLLMSGCSTLAETYFPPNRRGTATALAYSGGNGGQLLAFVIGPATLDDRAANVSYLRTCPWASFCLCLLLACSTHCTCLRSDKVECVE